MSEIRGTLLYEAATNALASDASGENTWTKMVTASFAHGSDRVSFYKELRIVEKQIKTEYALKSMPGAWRGAKSIVLAAMLAAIPMADENGKIRGKTSVQDALKEATPKIVKDVFTECKNRIDWVGTHRHLLNEAETMGIKTLVSSLLASL
mgnify:FL=1|tara:strand:- start:1033 stop:1485 length:453 start_codon:yes stop_codon:yes gene_type:complete